MGKLNFVAWLYAGGGQVEWTATHETSSATFEVQRSTNRQNWKAIGTMDAHPGYPDSYKYVFTDLNLRQYGVPVLYYRLRQLAQDGSFTYSPVRPVWLDKGVVQPSTALALRIWPNPGMTTQLQVESPEKREVSVIVQSAAGHRVYQQTTMPATPVLLPSASWPSGTYLIRAQQGSNIVTRTLVRN
ncbi:T9SS type A sorting domain-containing protein [Hymenobacter sp. ASUV-10]|uniref:T9SS type A sorting domain-containing protein n=1 Tax=Hymenobacter aranciens TaxID=3063996 RepID=A0ABT9BBK5_9BACT|nr:T9SS type A sorting domain-containing protein [Hymenobacter sp. ASUV-10]MDO7875018.1 T9SS type A sorting domain-containing protein [Hymenobacter sp. ASUV-10]